MPTLHEIIASEIKEDLFSWESIYPDLHPQQVLKTLMALWSNAFESSFDDYNSIIPRNTIVKSCLRHPPNPPPPPPCQLDDVEYELETTNILENTIIDNNPIFTNQSDYNDKNNSNEISITNTSAFPDLIPESFENIQKIRQKMSVNEISFDECENVIRHKIETMFLVIVLICSLALLYILPNFDT